MILLVGETASGKSTLAKELYEMGMKKIVTYTTRPKRPNEVNGEDYVFVNEHEFLVRMDYGFFIETTSYNVANGDTWYYGTPKQELDDNCVIVVNPSGLKAIKEIYPNAVAFHVNCPETIRRRRLVFRGDDEKEVDRRISADAYDFKDIKKYIDVEVANDGKWTPYQNARWIYDIYKEKMMG